LQDRIFIDSAGTHAYHVGEAPDSRSAAVAEKNGFSTAGLSARKISINDYDEFDYILAMDEDNLELIQYYAPQGHKAQIELFLNYSNSERSNVPDPYYGGAQGFDDVLDLVEQGCQGLLDQLDN
jgi:protein-tyrosine phosphatase